MVVVETVVVVLTVSVVVSVTEALAECRDVSTPEIISIIYSLM